MVLHPVYKDAATKLEITYDKANELCVMVRNYTSFVSFVMVIFILLTFMCALCRPSQPVRNRVCYRRGTTC